MVWRKGTLLILMLACIALPFEQIQPAVAYAGVQLTNLELIVYATLLLATPLLVRPASFWKVSLGLFAIVLGIALTAGVLAQDSRLALFATYRLVIGLVLAYVTYSVVVQHRTQQQWLYIALLGGASIAALVGAVEVFNNAPLETLSQFRGRATTVGPFLRLTSTFDHANQTAMYFEALVPLAVCGALVAIKRQRRGLAVLYFVIGAGVFAASVLTLSRASVVTSLCLAIALIGIAWWRKDKIGIQLFGATVALMGVILTGTFLLHPAWQLRLQSEGDDAWYRAQIQVPTTVSGVMAAQVSVPVTVENQGLLTWSEDLERPIRLGAHWYVQQENTFILLPNEPRWQFENDILPNAIHTWTVAVQLPEAPGNYRLEWDVVQEAVTWFSQKNGTVAVTEVTVTDSVVSVAQMTPSTNNAAVVAEKPAEQTLLPPIPHRRTLWRAAYLLWQTQPLIGIGFDNYRLQYGQVLEMPHFNDTIHTNNWYVEMFVSLGLLGALPFFGWLLYLLSQIWQDLGAEIDWLQLGLAAGIVAFMLHGLLDYFLLFNGTAFLFWILVGLWSGRAAHSR